MKNYEDITEGLKPLQVVSVMICHMLIHDMRITWVSQDLWKILSTDANAVMHILEEFGVTDEMVAGKVKKLIESDYGKQIG